MKDISILLILGGTLLIMAGIFMQLGLPLGRLPGDIIIEKPNFKLFFPITSSILMGIIASILFFVLKKL
ncbi:MAG: DUF2905 domain-containing protein [archaeon]